MDGPVGKDPKSIAVSNSRKQWTAFACLCVANFGLGIYESLFAPLFPKEAESKDITSSVYGLILGTFHLSTCVASPILGRFMEQVTPKFMIQAGVFSSGFCALLWAALDWCPPGTPFVGISFAVRVIEGLAMAAIKMSRFAIVGAFFPTAIASKYATVETFYGIGYVIGPVTGGALYEVGGFGLPMALVGLILLVCSLLFFCLPTSSAFQREQTSDSFIDILLHPSMIIDCLVIIGCSMCLGFIGTAGEPYLRTFGLSPTAIGVVFALPSFFFAVTSPIWGILMDRKINPKLLCAVVCIVFFIAFLFIGPAPFIPLPPYLWLTILSVCLYGCGQGGLHVLAYVMCFSDVVKRGFSDNMGTYGIVTGIVGSSIAVGLFLGMTTGGYLLDALGFRISTVPYICLSGLLVLMMSASAIWWHKKYNKKELSETTPLLQKTIVH